MVQRKRGNRKIINKIKNWISREIELIDYEDMYWILAWVLLLLLLAPRLLGELVLYFWG